MKNNKLAGKTAPKSMLTNIPRLVSAYYNHQPDVSDPGQQVVFGTSGHRGSSLKIVLMKITFWPSARRFVNIDLPKISTVRFSWGWIPMPCPNRPWRLPLRSLPQQA